MGFVVYFKVGQASSKKKCFICFSESPLKLGKMPISFQKLFRSFASD